MVDASHCIFVYSLIAKFLVQIFTQLKLCLAHAGFGWVKIIQICQIGGHVISFFQEAAIKHMFYIQNMLSWCNDKKNTITVVRSA